MYKWIAALAMLLVLTAAPAMAQRGDSHGIWKPHYSNTQPGRSFSGGGSFNFARPSYSYGYRPAAPAQGYQSFSFEPTPFAPGDQVAVTRDHANLMLGTTVVAAAPKGLEFKVTKVMGNWLGAVVTIEGTEFKGWIASTNVRLAN